MNGYQLVALVGAVLSVVAVLYQIFVIRRTSEANGEGVKNVN